jgi:hypothetical protein
MSDLDKYSVTGLDGVPRIDPIFTIPLPEPVISGRATFINEEPGKATDANPRPYTSLIVDQTKINPNPEIKPQDNLLNQYASYTYNISLHMLSVQTYNRLIGSNANNSNDAFNYVPENVLVVSGGRLGLNNQISDIETGTTIVQPQRHPFWQENFFFEEVKLRTVISPTQASRGTNVVEGSMQIIEPNGFTFINRLIQTVLNVNPGTNYIFNPYMIQIDFFGMHGNTEGSTAAEQNPVRLDGLKKLFPICMTGIKTKVTNKGTMYTIDFVPYSHKALSRINNVTPANFNIPATTVEEFFNNNKTTETATSISNARERELTLRKLRQDRQSLSPNDTDLVGGQLDTRIEEYENFVKAGVNVNGFCAAFNQFQQEMLKDKIPFVTDEIEIRFDPEIGKKEITKNASITQAVADQFLKAKNIILAQAGQGNQTIKFDGVYITVPAGTIIDKLIEFVVRNSSYFTDQISPYGDINRDTPLKWYKIVPRVELKQYDTFRKTFGTKTIYYVFPYNIYGASHPYVANGLPTAQVKKYDYIFTGKNTEVIDLSVDFNLLYNLSLPVNRTQENTAHDLAPELEPEDIARQIDSLFDQRNSYPIDPTQQYTIHLHSGQTQYQGTSGSSKILNQQELAASVLHSINLDSRGDMINVKLKILGDPDFIKQDDIFYNSYFFQKKDIRINNNGGSLWMDTGNLTIQLNINSPVDYDDTFGVAIPNRDPYGGIFTYNAFSGIYKIITIENVFSRGKFEQVLDIVRSPIQSLAQLKKADDQLQSNRDQLEKALSLARNVNNNRPSNLLNVPIRSTAGALGRTAGILYGQQSVVNNASSAVASLNGLIGGLQAAAAIPAMLTQIGVSVATRAVSNVIGKGIDSAAKAIQGAFNVPDQALLGSFEAAELGSSLSGPDLALLGSFEAAELDSSLNFISEINLAGF